MTFVVTEACIKCKYTDCVDVCPVDAFREGRNMLVIDPDDCIDCAVCVPECPVDAIFAEEDVPADQQDFTPLNAELARRWPTITRTKIALPDAEAWSQVKDKRAALDRGDPRQASTEAPDAPDAKAAPGSPADATRPSR